ncbi:MAG: cryptochrome/photolyase family protein [Elainellaceae cyanobacterium]
MTTGIWVLGDQLHPEQAALQQRYSQRNATPVIFIESAQYAGQRPYHRQKLVLVWSAMRHFSEALQQDGWPVTYAIAPDFLTPLIAWINKNDIQELHIMQPSDRPFQKLIETLDLPCAVVLQPNNHFLWSSEDFAQWASRRKSLLMEAFYREGRRRFQVMMTADEPEGGQWNYDKANRKPPKGDLNPPEPLWFEPDEITRQVIAHVQDQDLPGYGDIEPFRWGVTRSQATEVLDYFIEQRLAGFGPYQDAMVTGEETLWHAMLSPYLNLGLLRPVEVVEAVETAYYERENDPGVPINSAEGLIRQVMGWREYMRGIYTQTDDDYPDRNWFGHSHALPEFFWDSSKTKMNCLNQILGQVEKTAYAHHIQRLMVLSNFALIAGISPQAIEQWFHAAFIDAYDWVMQTNVIGMGQFADGGMLASKPYAASANYINRMSDYCKGCQYNHRQRTGAEACPFNFFYWDFLARHRERLKSQGRMSLILANLDKMSPDELEDIRRAAADWHQRSG